MEQSLQKKGKQQFSWVFVFYAIACLLLHILPMAKYSVPYFMAFPFALLFVVFIFLQFNEYRDTLLFLTVFGAICSIMIFLVAEPLSLLDTFNEFVRTFRFFVPALLFIYSAKCGKKISFIIWLVMSLLFVFVIITTLTALEENEEIARILAQGGTVGTQGEDLTEYRLQNVGGFTFAYAMGVPVPLFTYLAIHKKNIWAKIGCIAAVIFLLNFIIATQYTTLFILTFISIAAVIFFYIKNPVIRLLLFAVGVIIYINLGNIFDWLGSITEGSTLKDKFEGLADSIKSGKGLASTTGRVELYTDSLKTFLSSPIWGNTVFSRSHSTILTYAERTGIVGLFGYFAGICIYYKTVTKNLKSLNKKPLIFVICFMFFIILSALNPTDYAYELAYALLLYVPLSLYLFDDNIEACETNTNKKLEI